MQQAWAEDKDSAPQREVCGASLARLGAWGAQLSP